MNVCILGTARSGTTAAYSLLQDIMEDNFNTVNYYYEPFLWDIDTFNDRYENVKSHFDRINSISTEGIFNHTRLPLFIENSEKFIKNEYVNSWFKHKDKGSNLIKTIRSNGRVSLIHKIDPDCRFIVTLRNPLDTVNSLNNKFSFFGGEFHRDDFERFAREINNLFGAGITTDETVSYLEKQLLYWRYMNRYMLQAFDKLGIRPLFICQEELGSKPAEQVSAVCNFLGLPFDERYIATASERKSEVTRQFNISEKELNLVRPYLDQYFELLGKYSIPYSFNRELILDRYNLSVTPVIKEPVNYGKSPLFLMGKLSKLTNTTEILSRELDDLKRKNKSLMESATDLSKRIDDLKEENEILSEELQQAEDLKNNFFCRFINIFRKEKK